MAPTAAGIAASAMPIASFDQALLSINSNPYFIGSMMLMMNFGGRFLAMEMSPNQERFFQSPWVRRVLIFIVIFMGTRNILVAFWMTLVIILLVGYLFNENSSLCIFHLGQPGSSCASVTKNTEGTSPPTQTQLGSQMQPSSQFTMEEAEIFKRLNDKQMRIAASNRQESINGSSSSKSEQSISDIYFQNMMLLKQTDGFKSEEGFRSFGPSTKGFIGQSQENPRF
jgi:hypothetical protein